MLHSFVISLTIVFIYVPMKLYNRSIFSFTIESCFRPIDPHYINNTSLDLHNICILNAFFSFSLFTDISLGNGCFPKYIHIVYRLEFTGCKFNTIRDLPRFNFFFRLGSYIVLHVAHGPLFLETRYRYIDVCVAMSIT